MDKTKYEFSCTVLPASLDELVQAIGEQSTIKLVDCYGGTTQRLPARRNVTAKHDMVKIIGLDALKLLVSKVGGGRYVYIPRCADGLRQKRDREIVTKSNAGVSVEVLAREYGLSDRQIWNILKKTEMQTAQVSLF